MNLEIRLNGEAVDLFGDDTIVQSFSVINIEDITSRTSDYSNEIRLPPTNNNLRILDNAQFIISNTSVPYKRIPCEIYVYGFFFKRGFFQLKEIAENISGRFFTGNANFYDIIKNSKLTDLRLTSLDHTWDLATVFASRTNTTGYIYPFINYNQDTGIPTTDWDARRMAPAYFFPTLLEACCIENGYTFTNEMDASANAEMATGIVPLGKENPALPTSIINANLYSGKDINDQYHSDNYFRNGIAALQTITNNNTATLLFSDNPTNPTNLYNQVTGEFTTVFAGVYKFTYDVQMAMDVIELWSGGTLPPYSSSINYNLSIQVNGVSVITIIQSTHAAPGTTYSTFTNASSNQNYYLSIGDKVKFVWAYSEIISTNFFTGIRSLQSNIQTNFFDTATGGAFSTFSIELQPQVAFGQAVRASFFLPETTQGDFFKDMCIRYGLIPIVDEDNKDVKLISFSTIKGNIAQANDWSDIVDETNKRPAITFELGNYGQLNKFKHKKDESVLNFILGADYTLSINNENLKRDVDIYESPFAQSLSGTRGTIPCISINLYDDVNLEFSNKVQPRVCYVQTTIIGPTITWTDGVNTVTSKNVPTTWFISDTQQYNMGFGNNQIQRYSSDIVDILQGLKIVRQDFRLNLSHILNLRYDLPVFIKAFNSYFIISEIKEFNYTNQRPTEVTLIKLN